MKLRPDKLFSDVSFIDCGQMHCGSFKIITRNILQYIIYFNESGGKKIFINRSSIKPYLDGKQANDRPIHCLLPLSKFKLCVLTNQSR